MSDAFLAEVRPYSGGATLPVGWMDCDGRLLQITENPALYALLSTRFGGDGVTNFAIPDLRGRVPLHFGSGTGLSGRAIGETGGSETVAFTTDQLPSHSHALYCSTKPATTNVPGSGVVPAVAQPFESLPGALYTVPGETMPTQWFFDNDCLLEAGESQPHENRMASLAIRYMIAVQGTVPERPTTTEV